MGEWTATCLGIWRCKSISYVYDQTNGLRLSKTVDGVVHTYIYEGDKLMRLTIGSDIVMDFAYDHNGQPFAMKYNGTWIYYVLNLQGDVVRLVTASGVSYNTTTFDFTKGLSIRNWLANQPFDIQYTFGIGVLKDFGVTK